MAHHPTGQRHVDGVAIVPLAGFRLPDTSDTLREHVLAEDQQIPEYLEKYDRHTLFYDCVHDAARDRILITAPRLLNLWPVLRDGLRSAGHPVRGMRRRVYPKFEIISFRAPDAPLDLVIDGHAHSVMPRQSHASTFKGTNAIITMSRNNPLDWITDWLRFHVRAQGANAVMFVDNGSDAYTLETLAEAISGVDGLTTATVFSAPFPYGIVLHGSAARVKPNFLQSAILNLARVETLSDARAVLNADVDELVQGPHGASVFDAAARAWHGAVNIGGDFVFPAQDTAETVPQSAHVYRAVPPRVSTRKWCATPKGLLSRMGWYVHQVGGEPFKLVPASREFTLVHCSAANTNWMRQPANARPAKLAHDPKLQAMMDTYLHDG